MTRMFTSLTLGDVLGRHWGFVVRLYEVEAEFFKKALEVDEQVERNKK